MRDARKLYSLVAAVLCAGSLPVLADVIFDDFGPGFDYNTGSGWTVGGPTSNVGEFEAANLFTAAVSASVTQIDVALALVTGDGGATVSLWTNSGGLPGVELGSWPVVATVPFGNPGPPVSITGISGVNVTGGQDYFLQIVADSPTWDAWNLNTQGVTGLDIYSQDGGASWTANEDVLLGAFDVLGTRGDAAGVPEPSSLMLLGLGTLMLAGWRRVRSK